MAAARSSLSPDLPEATPPVPEVWREGHRTVVAIRGEQDLGTAGCLAEALRGAAAIGGGDLVVDLSGVRFMDAAIVNELVRCHRQLRTQGRQLALRSPSAFARRILGICGLVDLVDPVPAATAGSIGTCLTVRGSWSRPPPRRRAVVVVGRAGSSLAASVPSLPSDPSIPSVRSVPSVPAAGTV
jgi:anti-anti-sigma factor